MEWLDGTVLVLGSTQRLERDNHEHCRPKQGGQWPTVASASMGQSQLRVKGTRC
jgi:hypothetical protein